MFGQIILKKIITILLLLIVALHYSWAQHQYPQLPQLKVERKHALKLNFLSPMMGSVSAFYQFAAKPSFSVQAGFAFMEADFSRVQQGFLVPDRYQAFCVTADFRFTVNKTGLSGPFLQPFIRYISAENYFSRLEQELGVVVKQDYYTDYGTSLGIGAVMGYQKMYHNRYLLEFYVGPMHTFLLDFYGTDPRQTYKKTTLDSPLMRGIGIRCGATVGLAF